jgi:hypothetical protein
MPLNPNTRQRESTSHIKSWTAPWHTELFTKYHEQQHGSIWTEYQSLFGDSKHTFFDNKEKFKHMIHNAFGNNEDSLIFDINSSIILEIIGDIFFHPDDHGGVSQ